MKHFLPILFLLSTLFAVGQENSLQSKLFSCAQLKTAGDVSSALDAGSATKIMFKCTPVGSGEQVEVASGKKKDQYFFENENNIVWIKFTTPTNGIMSFDIIPKNVNDDYDFLLFKINKPGDLKRIAAKKLTPIRSNMSRNKKELRSITGLSPLGSKPFVVSGVQDEYSKQKGVKKGDVFYIALNNVYDGGEGAIIKFSYNANKKLTGIIKDENEQPVAKAEVKWEDAKTGKVLAKTETDNNGKFAIVVPYNTSSPKHKYVLSAESDNYFFKEKNYSSAQLQQEQKPINMVLPELKKGKRYQIHNINFVGNQATLLPGAYPSLKRLHKLMKKNPKLKITIEGHTNGCHNGLDFVQKLSEDRAARVKKYLLDKKINAPRMKTIGYNCQRMLYPNAASEHQQMLNRRVEILVTDY